MKELSYEYSLAVYQQLFAIVAGRMVNMDLVMMPLGGIGIIDTDTISTQPRGTQLITKNLSWNNCLGEGGRLGDGTWPTDRYKFVNECFSRWGRVKVADTFKMPDEQSSAKLAFWIGITGLLTRQGQCNVMLTRNFTPITDPLRIGRYTVADPPEIMFTFSTNDTTPFVWSLNRMGSPAVHLDEAASLCRQLNLGAITSPIQLIDKLLLSGAVFLRFDGREQRWIARTFDPVALKLTELSGVK